MAKKTSNRDTVRTPSTDQISMNMIVLPKNEEQKKLMEEISKNTITFVKGSPGSGKTFVAVHYAIQQLLKKRITKIVLTRPVVEAGGEKLGFLPGDMSDKINPYMFPIFDALHQLLPYEVVKKMINKNGEEPVIRILPLAYMRGTTLKDCIVLCDEMQNSTPEQMRMLLTRIGENSQMIICGDIRQSDIHNKNGLEDAFELLTDISNIGFVTLTSKAIVRHPIIGSIEERYEERARAKREKNTK